MDPERALPQAVLRAATDRRLLDETIRRRRTTRAELAAVTGYSRPTVSEAVRRMVAQGLLDASGLQETGRRGRVGTFYSLGACAGWVLALEISQAGVRARATDLAGAVLHEDANSPTLPGDVGELITSVRTLVHRVTTSSGTTLTTATPPPASVAAPSSSGSSLSAAGGPGGFAVGRGPLRAIGVSVANPVNPGTQAVVPLAGTPFPEGLLSPEHMLHDLTNAPVLVDNDVNLAALAEHRVGRAAGESSFAYVYLGAGMGVGLYLNGRLIRGAHGLAGEIGYLPGIVSPTLSGDLRAGGFDRKDAPSVNIDAVLALLDQPSAPAIRQLAEALSRAITSVAAVVDPALFLLGGPVGTHPALLREVRELTTFPGAARIEHGALGPDAPLTGAVQLALEHARATATAA
ncbi:ROK family transcriptional regulator [Actinoplanes sp. NBRC 103695]|uniref:ROK family transcriptional regulator n=1 Tax=Actinoplanes sp. NBRC 103695 TaxID=3032202 RepID=UPI0024A44ADE|nr:ROK family transcriptional regulator [Actinoplanes sp. NBRC 103695]GLY94218.1 hypothetical protein Acsp02_14740 [Actinoplanes sp. NBRC 103695]